MAAKRMTTVGFLGAGQMATALSVGLIRAGYVEQNNVIASASSERSVSLQNIKKRGIRVTTDNKEVVEKSQIVWLAVKPHAIKRTIEDIAPVIRPDYHLIVSAAAGIPIKTMEKALPEKCKLFRTMPNTPVIVQNGVTIYAPGTNVDENDRKLLTEMLSSIGLEMEMEEHYMDIMTALSGGGPSYMYMIMDALADGGVYAGVPKHLALKLTAYTMMGSAKMVLENGSHPQELKDAVCSPAGTAIQGIRLLEREGFRGMMMDAVHASSKRALELSRLANGEDKDIYVKR